MITAENDYALQAFDVMDDVEARSDLVHLKQRLTTFLALFGFDKFVLTRLPLPRDRLSPNIIVRVWPSDFLHHYDAQRFYRDDPVADRVFTSTEPFLWSDVPVPADRTSRSWRVMATAAEAGMRDGYCIPVHDIHGFQGAVSMAGEHIDLPPRAKRAVQVLALVAFGVAGRHAGRSPQIKPLSLRECEVLKHLGAGLTASEVGDRLGIADSTVATLLARARQKLRTVNTVHTIVEALRFRQISL